MGDPIPKDHISLTEAFRIYRRAKHGENCEESPPSGTPQWQDWYTKQSIEIDGDVAALTEPFLSGELEAIVSQPGSKEYRIRAAELNRAGWPSQLLLCDQISDLPSGKLAKFSGRTPYISRDKFMMWLEQYGRRIAETRLSHSSKGKRRVYLVDAIAELIGEIWPNGVPEGLKAKDRNAKIIKEAKRRGLSQPSLRTIGRALVNRAK